MGPAPEPGELAELLGRDTEAMEVVFEASIAEVVERHVADERLRTALHGQGIIGTYAGPRDPGTAAVHLMHASGTLEGQPGAWGYVKGGMGRVAFALADAAIAAGAVLASGVTVAAVLPGEGVVLDSGERIEARAVVSNADPKRTLALCRSRSPPGSAPAWAPGGPTARSSRSTAGFPGSPSFPPARPGAPSTGPWSPSARGSTPPRPPTRRSRRGEPAPAWCELYFHTAYDPSIAPPGRHAMSIFAQYVPYRLARGGWDDRREEIGDAAIDEVARFAPGVADLHRCSARCSARRTSKRGSA